MDVDISDILASVSRPLPPTTTSSSRHNQSHHTPSDTLVHTDHQLLVRAWTSERCSPSLLPYPTDLMTRVTARVAAQIARIEDLTGSVPSASDPNGYGHTHTPGYGYSSTTTPGGGLASSKNLTLILSILQTDLSRTQFLLRSLLRQRLSKLTRHAMFYLSLLQQHQTSECKSKSKEPQTQTQTSLLSLLSESEISFLRHHQALLSNFYTTSFLSAFPAKMRRLDDSSGGMGNVMVEGPDVGVAVVVRCLVEEWGNEGDVGRDVGGGGGGTAGTGVEVSVELRMRRGQVWVVRWGDVRRGVEGGELEVL